MSFLRTVWDALARRHWHREHYRAPDLSRPDERVRHARDDEDWPAVREDAR